MNSYPLELLAQLAPVMFVAGLDIPNPPNAHSSSSSVAEKSSTSRPQDPFTLLSLRLRDALLAQRKVSIWQPEKHKLFQVVLVHKDVSFPPRKLVPPEDPQYSSAHSPLSPLTPSSPLHPDGLIAPIWIRKHTTLVPSVFVLFMRLFEVPPHNATSPLDAPDPEREKERDQEERRRDTELAAEIAHRKKSTNERNVKLTVVLMASRKMLDDPSLDTRLTYIRRQSGLDSRAALFVLSPVSQSELGDFIRSLQQALYEPALEYYTSHSKRVRRKRNRHSQAVSSYPNPLSPSGSAGIARPLRPEGWTVRYEYKMACFAEFRGEDEVALKHYQDAYEMLVIMFGSTVTLTPRTKRWAEAKVLADCINVKITKLYLYNNEHALALSHHNTHMRKFGDFSRGWGIGEETFEYWSWMARQHRILAELLEHGTRSNLVIPVHRPVVSSSAMSNVSASAQVGARSTIPGMELESMRSLGINPNHALQHPGFYYYMAARCTESRRERYLAALEAEERDRVPSSSPGFANEKKVDHLTIILELYTKAYELFKQHTPENQTQGRLPLWIAYRIAQTYTDSGKFDLAVRFFERIAKAYRREQWGLMLRPLLATWYASAQQLGDVELSVRLLIEMLGHGAKDLDEPGSLEEDLSAVLESTVPSTTDEPLVIDNSEFQPIFDSSLVFWTPEVKVGELAAFQLSLTAPAHVTISSLPFTSLEIHFSEIIPPLVVRHAEASAGESSSAVRKVDLGHVRYCPGGKSTSSNSFELETNLRWTQGQIVVFAGTISSDVPTSLTISHLVLKLVKGAWNIEVPLHACKSSQEMPPAGRWLSSLSPLRFIPVNREDFSSVDVRHRPHTVLVSLSHQSPAYLNEEFPIDINVTNADDKELEISMDILLQPTEVDFAINTIFLDDHQSNAMIKGISFGLLAPGASIVKTLQLLNTGAAGDRMIDISIQSRCQADSSTTIADDTMPELQDATETLQTVVIPTVDPLKATTEVIYRRSTKALLGLADLRGYESDYRDDVEGGEAILQTVFECVGPWNLDIESFVLKKREHSEAQILSSSSEEETGLFPSEYEAGDEFSDICHVSIAAPDQEGLPIPGPGEYHVTWRRVLSDEKRGSTAISVFPLPTLQPPVDELIALLDISPLAKLHHPTPLTLTIQNRHPSRSANVTVQFESDPSDSFVVAGWKAGRVSILMPGAEEKLLWKLIPIECGHVKIPKIKVLDRRVITSTMPGGADVEGSSDGTVVKIVDVRVEQRHGEAVEDENGMEDETIGTVLVLP